MRNILVICEQEDGKIKKYSKELVFKASELASAMGCEVEALVFGVDAKDDAATLGVFGAGNVKLAAGNQLSEYNADQYLAAAEKIINEIKPGYVLATASSAGRDLMPRLAVRFDCGMATECIDFVIDKGDIRFRRPQYAGKVWADVKVNSDIKFATVRPNMFSIGEAKCLNAVVKTVDIGPVQSKVALKEKVQAEAKQLDLVEANVIVSGGRAMGNKENYNILRELADVLNASIGASRAAVDAGYISHDHQVGQTGKTVNPALYIACGISGAIQHLAGMRTSKIIVAINKDPDAPIFLKADFGIVGDLFKVVPAVTEKLKKVVSS